MAIVKDLGMVTAYAYAVAGGYEGTEAEFTELLGQAGVTLEQLENLSAVAVTLSPGSEATASYSDGVLTFGIPQGATGETGQTGPQGPEGPTGNGIVSITKTGTSGLVDTYTITFTNGNTTTFTVTNGEDGTVTPEQMAQAIADALDTFSGETHEYLTAGMAEQLLSDVVTTDKKPYKFRRTGADATREYDTLVGGSVVANQLVNSTGTTTVTVRGVTWTKNGDTFTATGTAESETGSYVDAVAAISVPSDHVVFLRGCQAGGSTSTYALIDGYKGVTQPDNGNGVIYKAASGGKVLPRMYVFPNTTVSDIVFRPQVTDLTVMFGSAIAEYAYTLEQSTAGAGIAWLKSYGFFAGYQAYNAGSMVHVSGVSAHVMKDADDNIIGNYPLDNTLTFRGIPKLADGEIYYDGDVYWHDGTVTRKYGIRAYQEGDESLTDAITDGTNTVYKLQTPTTESASPYQSPQICNPDGTEQYITDGIPVGHDTQYPANLKGEIERVMVQVPKPPTSNGTYSLKCTVSASGVTYAWTS